MAALALAVAIAAAPAPQGKYADLGGARMYYEVHGDGPSVLLLRSGLGTIGTTFSKLLPKQARDHRVTAVEQVGDGHSPDREGPYSYAEQAENTAALLRQLGVSGARSSGTAMVRSWRCSSQSTTLSSYAASCSLARTSARKASTRRR